MTRTFVLLVLLVLVAACRSSSPASTVASEMPDSLDALAARLLAHEEPHGHLTGPYHGGIAQSVLPELTRQFEELTPALLRVAGVTQTAPAGEIHHLGYPGGHGHDIALVVRDRGAHRVEVLFDVADTEIVPIVAVVSDSTHPQPFPGVVVNDHQACIRYRTRDAVVDDGERERIAKLEAAGPDEWIAEIDRTITSGTFRDPIQSACAPLRR